MAISFTPEMQADCKIMNQVAAGGRPSTMSCVLDNAGKVIYVIWRGEEFDKTHVPKNYPQADWRLWDKLSQSPAGFAMTEENLVGLRDLSYTIFPYQAKPIQRSDDEIALFLSFIYHLRPKTDYYAPQREAIEKFLDMIHQPLVPESELESKLPELSRLMAQAHKEMQEARAKSRSVTYGQILARILANDEPTEDMRTFLHALTDKNTRSPLEKVIHDNATLGIVSLTIFGQSGEDSVISEEELKHHRLDPETLANELGFYRGFFDKTNYVQQNSIPGRGTGPTPWGAVCKYRNFAQVIKLFGDPVPTPEHSMSRGTFDALLDDCLSTEIRGIETATGKAPDAGDKPGAGDFAAALKKFYVEELDPVIMLGIMQHTLEAGEYEGEKENVRLLRESCIRICEHAVAKIHEQQPKIAGRA